MMAPCNRLILLVGLVAGTAALGVAVFPGFATVEILAAAAIGALALIDAGLAAKSIAGITVTGPALIRTVRDRATALPFSVVNHGAGAVRSVRAALEVPETFRMEASAQQGGAILTAAQQFDFSAQFESRRRGEFRIACASLEAQSPFGLWSARKSAPLDVTVRVYPNMRADPVAAEFLRRASAGSRQIKLTGKGREFAKLREYAPGDSYDEIEWKATARRGRPVVRVFQAERTQEVYVAIDASRLSARPLDGHFTLEHYVTAALAMGLAAEDQGDRFGMVTFSDRLHKFVPARAGKRHYAVCRDAIYQLEPRVVEPDFAELFGFLQTRLRKRALIVILTALDDPLNGETFARCVPIASRRHLVMAAMVRPEGARPLFEQDAPSVDDTYGQLAGHLRWRRLFELTLECRRKGVRLHLLNPEKISGQLAALYWDVKRRQQL